MSPDGWYCLDCPDGWVSEIDDVCTSFFREDGIGAFQISAYETESRESAAKNLQEYLDSEGIEAAIEQSAPSDGFESASTVFVQDDSVNKVWMFASDRRFVFVTYVKEIEDRADKEEAEVEQMIRSLKLND